jgi:hypothetical protein
MIPPLVSLGGEEELQSKALEVEQQQLGPQQQVKQQREVEQQLLEVAHLNLQSSQWLSLSLLQHLLALKGARSLSIQ